MQKSGRNRQMKPYEKTPHSLHQKSPIHSRKPPFTATSPPCPATKLHSINDHRTTTILGLLLLYPSPKSSRTVHTTIRSNHRELLAMSPWPNSAIETPWMELNHQLLTRILLSRNNLPYHPHSNQQLLPCRPCTLILVRPEISSTLLDWRYHLHLDLLSPPAEGRNCHLNWTSPKS